MDVGRKEIRLVTLLPGSYDDPIEVEIWHQALQTPPKASSPRSLVEELEKTLPRNWRVFESIDHKLFFWNTCTKKATFEHPDTAFDDLKHRLPPEYSSAEFEPKFEALSYTWGAEHPQYDIFVVGNGFSSKNDERKTPKRQRLSVRDNLMSGLRHLRSEKASRTLWMDALCINQADVEERGIQVKQMGNIYKTAIQVVIWIGTESKTSSLALKTLGFLGAQVEHTAAQWYPSPDASKPEWGDPRVALSYGDGEWDSICDLLSRPWFERVWVTQEARLARRAAIQCGPDVIPWNTFRRAILTLREKPSLPDRLKALIKNIRELCNSRFQNDFFRLMCMNRRRHCFDPRDKLYGILSLVPSPIARRIIPGYGKPLNTAYRESMIAYCDISGRLDLLSHVDHRTASWQSPSWVPDWSNQPQNYLQTTYFSPAAGMSKAELSFKPPFTLHVKGVLVGDIRCSENVLSENGRLVEIWKNTDFLTPWESRGLAQGSLLDAFLELVSATATRERYPTNLSYPYLGEIKLNYVEQQPAEARYNDTTLPGIRMLDLSNLCFAVTSNGFLALAPLSTAPGN